MPNADDGPPLACAICQERDGTQLAMVPADSPEVERIVTAFRSLGHEPEIVAGMLEVVCDTCGAILDHAWRDAFIAKEHAHKNGALW